ncbi:FitA-like ribbon-helix-helix domain-containing protein [Corynebacterium cystitidis]|uniref:Arc-like DNA binding domain-containing protein n=1 Tax=Corynebacterium cystitidis DSM 20524 TaxID=1121357 RepID=A0A1H9R9C5_9CORY|nr:Arc family DNA-binding protein [Corynebacterium cystitidis]WJY81508.1 Arc-like DNA binding domain protein [Corynebacterium cystitidis DSM 20524]SER69332.1 Arc-like DNA binding domain-containing protein [Corynebacterium cystitidis DSM 20524]SNV86798.1 bifunctional SbtC-like/phosphopantothenoylcysteine decarboxylase/phosphopantothenate synthase [Corynebacterium cystitidis]
MASIVVRALPDETKQKLKERAARNGRSMEAEVRALIEAAVEVEAPRTRGVRSPWLRDVLERVQEVGGIDIADAPRKAVENPRIPNFQQ